MPHKQTKRNQILKQVLLYVAETTSDLANLGIQIMLDPPVTIAKVIDLERYSRKQIREAEYRLKRSSYVHKASNGKYALTLKGRVQTLQLVIKKQLLQIPRKWNGTWLVVSFDIPELARKDRERLWRQVRLLGFLSLQKSVWVTPLDIEDELLALLKLWRTELAGDVRILRVDRIVHDEDLKKYFKL
jgi:DNA-binding transcriptional regulator PaaX